MSTDYDVIVIGAGAAGLTAAGVSTHLGARTLLVEEDRMGGDCTWTGCVPSKALLSAAHASHAARQADAFGIRVGEVSVDFPTVMARVRALREEIYVDADAPEVYEKMGVDVRHGTAAFVDDNSIIITGRDTSAVVGARKFVIATGASPFVPPIDGLASVPHLTTETLFEIESLPQRLLVLGAGPVGLEMAQAFQRLGAEVTVLDTASRILQQDDAELADMMQTRLEAEGITFMLDADVVAARAADDEIELDLRGRGARGGDALLVATGRRPNPGRLNLEAVGVAYAPEGIEVDDRCRTSRSHIFAAGDVTGRFAFTHMAEHMAKTAVMNALLKVPSRIDAGHVPWVTYTDPELAHAGATEQALIEDGSRFETYRFPYHKLDRAVTERRPFGLIKVHARGWNGKILGASILGTRAGELISEYALAMRNGIRLRQISDTVHPYPSYGLGVRRAADQWYLRRRSRRLVRMLQRVFGYRGPVLEYGPDDVI